MQEDAIRTVKIGGIGLGPTRDQGSSPRIARRRREDVPGQMVTSCQAMNPGLRSMMNSLSSRQPAKSVASSFRIQRLIPPR